MTINRSNHGFTLTEIMIILGIFGIIIAIAAPTWFRQRELSRAVACQENLYKIHGAETQYALEFRLGQGAPVSYPSDLVTPGGVAQGAGYLRAAPECPGQGVYSLNAVGETPVCSVGNSIPGFPPHTFEGR
jgi:prepilin-type N-terminal cleavage/methylation domain-containing protein